MDPVPDRAPTVSETAIYAAEKTPQSDAAVTVAGT